MRALLRLLVERLRAALPVRLALSPPDLRRVDVLADFDVPARDLRERKRAMPEDLPRDENRRLDLDVQRAELERRRVPVLPHVAQKLLVAGLLLGAPAAKGAVGGLPSRCDDIRIAAHVVNALDCDHSSSSGVNSTATLKRPRLPSMPGGTIARNVVHTGCHSVRSPSSLNPTMS